MLKSMKGVKVFGNTDYRRCNSYYLFCMAQDKKEAGKDREETIKRPEDRKNYFRRNILPLSNSSILWVDKSPARPVKGWLNIKHTIIAILI